MGRTRRCKRGGRCGPASGSTLGRARAGNGPTVGPTVRRHRATGIVGQLLRRSGADSRAAPAGCPDPGGARRSSNAARGPAASATRPLFARPVALHCGKPVWSGRRGTAGADGASARRSGQGRADRRQAAWWSVGAPKLGSRTNGVGLDAVAGKQVARPAGPLPRPRPWPQAEAGPRGSPRGRCRQGG